ncbi:MAG: reverse transcriptase domain-containing protein [Bacteroidota bacterium]
MRFKFDKQHGYALVRAYAKVMTRNLGILSEQSYQEQYLINIALDPEFGLIENLGATTLLRNPQLLKVKAVRDPDTPNIGEAMSGPHIEELLAAMAKEIEELEKHNTWEVVKCSDIPKTEGAMPNSIPSTWAFKIKRYPDGRLRKFKGRFCVRGDRQVEGVDYFESYAPVTSWSSIGMILVMALQHDWTIKQVDFSNTFVQAPLDMYLHATNVHR